MVVHNNSLKNLKPGFGKKIEAEPVSMRLSRPSRVTIDVVARLHQTDKTSAVEMLPELWLTLAACAEVIHPESDLGVRLASLKAKEVRGAIASVEVLANRREAPRSTDR